MNLPRARHILNVFLSWMLLCQIPLKSQNISGAIVRSAYVSHAVMDNRGGLFLLEQLPDYSRQIVRIDTSTQEELWNIPLIKGYVNSIHLVNDTLFAFGQFFDTVIIGNQILVSAGEYDLFQLVCDRDGNFSVSSEGSWGREMLNDVVADKQGDFYLTGGFLGATVLGDFAGAFAEQRPYLAKISRNSWNVQWIKIGEPDVGTYVSFSNLRAHDSVISLNAGWDPVKVESGCMATRTAAIAFDAAGNCKGWLPGGYGPDYSYQYYAGNDDKGQPCCLRSKYYGSNCTLWLDRYSADTRTLVSASVVPYTGQVSALLPHSRGLLLECTSNFVDSSAFCAEKRTSLLLFDNITAKATLLLEPETPWYNVTIRPGVNANPEQLLLFGTFANEVRLQKKTLYSLEENVQVSYVAFLDLPPVEITALKKEDRTGRLFLTPNPARGTAYIQGSSPADQVALRIVDLHGRPRLSRKYQGSHTYHIELGTLEPGLYIAEISTVSGRSLQKIVVE